MGKRSYYADVSAIKKSAFRSYWRERKLTQTDIDELRKAYVEKYGYAIVVPDFNDIVHWKSPEAMTPAELKALKMKHLQSVLQSPAPEIARSYASVMTWIDNVQDAMTTGVVAAGLLVRWAPRVMARFVPYLGWAMLAYDVMNVLNTLARTPMAPLGIKRNLCQTVRDNPFTKKAQKKRVERLKNIKPSFGNLLEVYQTLDNVAGVGLCLGGVVGFFQDIFWGAYREQTGKPITLNWTAPKVNMHEFLATQGQKGAAMINSGGQTFDDEFHFWTYVTAAGSSVITAPLMENENLWEIIPDPMSTILPAPRPTDPLTLAVIQEAGLDVDAGCLWPANGAKEISMDELTDWQAPRLRESFQNFCKRHQNDWYGFVAACMTSQANEDIFNSIDPGSETIETYIPSIHVVMQMTKKGIWFVETPTKEAWQPFEDWCDQFWSHYGDYPGVKEARNKLDLLGIATTTTKPETYDAETQRLFPPEALNETLWEETFE